jgi:hypothetical protein
MNKALAAAWAEDMARRAAAAHRKPEPVNNEPEDDRCG